VKRLWRDRAALAALIAIGLVTLLAVAAPAIAAVTGHGPDEQFRQTGLTPTGLPVPPNGEFWLGTDGLGRDVLVRLAYGARVSLLAGVVASTLAVLLGVVVGLAGGYLGGTVDGLLGRLMDVVLAFPVLLFAIALVSVSGPGLAVSVLVIAGFSWASVGRVVRGEALAAREREYVTAARSIGAGAGRIMFVEVLPNVAGPVIVSATLLVPTAILFEATLSFLGLGIAPPTASWGGMLAEAQEYYRVAWWFLLFPALALLLTTLAFNLLGDGLRDALAREP